MPELVSISIKDHIADVRLNRPEKMNALSFDMFEAITEAGQQIIENKDVRVVVLSGEGKGFCAGMDISNLSDDIDADTTFGSDRGGCYPNFFQKPSYIWKSIPVPVICAMHGVAIGGGIQIALGADIRIAHPKTKLSLMEIAWGIIPDMAASQTLRDVVRLDVAKELMYSGRIIQGDEALEIGLVTSLSETPLETAMTIAKTISIRNPDAVSYVKYLLDNTWHGDDKKGLYAEETFQKQLLGSPNQREAAAAAFQKRPPNFAHRTISTFDDIDISNKE